LLADAFVQWGENPRVFYVLPCAERARRLADADQGHCHRTGTAPGYERVYVARGVD
jgi:hypothetical protein